MTKCFLPALIALCLLAVPAWSAGMWVYESGAWKSVPVPSVYVGGAYHAVNQGWTYQGGAWHLFFSSLQVSASDVTGTTSLNVGSCATPETGIPNTTVTGGSGSFTYAWSYLSGDTNTATDPGSTVQNPKWFPTAPGLCTGSGGTATADAVWHLVVTDTVTLATVSTNINVHLEYDRP